MREPPVPPMISVAGVQDPNARIVLQAIISYLAERHKWELEIGWPRIRDVYEWWYSRFSSNKTNTYTVTNDAEDRTYDANATTTEELADVLATLLTDIGLR